MFMARTPTHMSTHYIYIYEKARYFATNEVQRKQMPFCNRIDWLSLKPPKYMKLTLWGLGDSWGSLDLLENWFSDQTLAFFFSNWTNYF